MNVAQQPGPQSMLQWVISSLGFPYAILLPMAGLLAFVLTMIYVLRGRGVLGGISLLFIVLMPFFIGIFGALDGAIRAFSVIAMSDVSVKSSEIAAGVSEALVVPTVGLLFMAPSYIVAMAGLFARSFAENDPEGRMMRKPGLR